MKYIGVNLSEEQIEILKKQKNKSGIPISFQIREAVDLYIKTKLEK